jgi:PAS domain S-box-containing protein
MLTFDWLHLAILTGETILFALLIVLIFWFKKFLGKGLVYAIFGMIGYIQIFMSSTIYFELAPGFIVSPGSVVVFTGMMYAVLMFYVREDAVETRKLIYVMFIANAFLTILLLVFDWHIEEYEVLNPNEKSLSFMRNSAWVMLINTLGLIVDVFLIIFIYEFISRIVKPLYFRILIAMSLMQIINSAFFMGLAFWHSAQVFNLIFSAIVGKFYTGIFFSAFAYFYLKNVDVTNDVPSDLPFKGLFSTLSYRQKFELMLEEKKMVQQQAVKALEMNELKYKTLISTSPVGIFLTDEKGSTIYVNPKWCEITGLSVEKALGFGWVDALVPEDQDYLSKTWKKAAAHHDSSTVEYRYVRPNGKITWVLGQAIPDFDAEGNLIGYVGTITDITLLKEYEQTLQTAKQKAEEGEHLKTMFLQNISHEIRTPLNAICGSANLLNDTYFSSEQRESLVGIIQTSSNQLLSIVTDVLSVASLEAGQEKKIIRKTSLNGIFAELEEKFRPIAEQKSLELKFILGLDNDISVVFTDRSKLLRILSNLLSNAFKFTANGYVHAGYSLTGNQLEFFVKDSGIGIAKEQQDHIFDTFRQADKSIQYEYGGSGLGLSICKGFVELLGGSLRIESDHGKGAAFYFNLPYDQH